VDEMMLALLYLNSTSDRFGTRTWKGLNVETIDRLLQKGYIRDLGTKSPTMLLSEEGARLSKELFIKYFAKTE
jgi:hypothetical protein